MATPRQIPISTDSSSNAKQYCQLLLTSCNNWPRKVIPGRLLEHPYCTFNNYPNRGAKRLRPKTWPTKFNLHFHRRYYASLEFKIICSLLADHGIILRNLQRNATLDWPSQLRTVVTQIWVLQGLRELRQIDASLIKTSSILEMLTGRSNDHEPLDTLVPRHFSTDVEPKSTLHDSQDPSFERARTDTHGDKLILVWKVALNYESKLWSGEAAAAASKMAPVEQESGQI